METLLTIFMPLLVMAAIAGATSAKAMIQEEAEGIAAEAHIYFHSLGTMDITRRQQAKTSQIGPLNWLVSVRAHASSNDKPAEQPNLVTLHSDAWLHTDRMTCQQAQSEFMLRGYVYTRTRSGAVVPTYGGVPVASGRRPKCLRQKTRREIQINSIDRERCPVAYVCR